MLIERDLTRGGEHTVQCTDDVLWNCAAEICMFLLTSVTLINLTKKGKNKITKSQIIH